MLTSIRLKLGLFLSVVLLILLLIKSFVPRLLTHVVSLFDSQTELSCTTRCGDSYELSLPSEPLTLTLDPIIDVVATEPEPAFLRTVLIPWSSHRPIRSSSSYLSSQQPP
ncbi:MULTISPECIES: hypothetical protein [Exiguobacterium]|uniref:hypothetical protein n=1 Tax=Exiguobacterium TaxID=33986 RepID=UPI001F1FC1BB|nr:MULTISPECIES: hypothetical protein [Exiguobacterium]MCT4781383.1 hypothetical protein [Exiguobacterium soli]